MSEESPEKRVEQSYVRRPITWKRAFTFGRWWLLIGREGAEWEAGPVPSTTTERTPTEGESVRGER